MSQSNDRREEISELKTKYPKNLSKKVTDTSETLEQFLNPQEIISNKSIYWLLTVPTIKRMFDRDCIKYLKEYKIPVKIGEAPGSIKKAMDRIAAEFPATDVHRPSIASIIILEGIFKNKEDDRNREYYIEEYPELFSAVPSYFSDKKTNGEFIFLNVKALGLLELQEVEEFFEKVFANDTIDSSDIEATFTKNEAFLDVLNSVAIKYTKLYLSDTYESTDVRSTIPLQLTNKQISVFGEVRHLIDEKGIKYINAWLATRLGKTILALFLGKYYNLHVVYLGKDKNAFSSLQQDFENWFAHGDLRIATHSLNGGGQNKKGNKSRYNPYKILKDLKEAEILPSDKELLCCWDEADKGSSTEQGIENSVSAIKVLLDAGYKIKFSMAMSATNPDKGESIMEAVKKINDDSEEIGYVSMSYEESRALDSMTPPRHIMVLGFEDENKYSFNNSMERNQPKNLKESLANNFYDDFLGDVSFGRVSMNLDKNNPHIYARLPFVENYKLNDFSDLLQKRADIKNEKISIFKLFGELDSKNKKSNKIVEYSIDGESYSVVGSNSIQKKYRRFKTIPTRLLIDKSIRIEGVDYSIVKKMSNKEAQKISNMVISENPLHRFVFMSSGMSTTSFTVKTIGRTIVTSFDGMSSDIYQGAHRCTTSNGKSKKAQMIIISNEEQRFNDPVNYEVTNGSNKYGSKDERESTFKLFNNNGGVLNHVLVKANGNIFDYASTNKQDTMKIIENQMFNIGQYSNILKILKRLDIDLGYGVSKDGYKGSEFKAPDGLVDGSGNPTTPTPRLPQSNNKEDELNFERMAKGIYDMFVFARLMYFIPDIDTALNDVGLFSIVNLDKDAVNAQLLLHEDLKDSIAMRWDNIGRLSDSAKRITLSTIMGNNKLDEQLLKDEIDILFNEVDFSDKKLKNSNLLVEFSSRYWIFLAIKLQELNNEHPSINITIDISDNRYHPKFIEDVFGNVNNVKYINTQELIKGDKTMKKKGDGDFDIIIGNPPFDTSDGSDNNKPYFNITKKCIHLLKSNGILSFITPRAILFNGQQNSAFEYLKNHVRSINHDVNNDFIISQNVTQFTFVKDKFFDEIKFTKNNKTTLIKSIDDTDIRNSIINKVKFKDKKDKLAIICSNKRGGIENKFIHNDKQENSVEIISHKTQKQEKNIFYTFEENIDNQYNYSHILIPYYGKEKEDCIIVNSPYTGQFYLNKNEESDEWLVSCKSYLDSKLIRYCIQADKDIRSAKAATFLNLIKSIDMTNVWSDTAIYNEFGISNSEIKIIEDWYSTWKK